MIFLPNQHPSVAKLQQEGIKISYYPAPTATPRIVLLNLMPQKQEAEEEYYRVIDSTGLDVEIVLAKMSGLTYKNTPQIYMDTYYDDIAMIMEGGETYDGMIVTGAPLEHLNYEEVTYWQQLHDVYHWSFSKVKSTLNICWGAYAAMRMFFGIDKHSTAEKLFGVYLHHNNAAQIPLMEGLDKEVFMPISRHITLKREEVAAEPLLSILLDQETTGPGVMMAWQGRQIFVNGHLEYTKTRLSFEYERDVNKGLPIHVPINYFCDNIPSGEIIYSWQESGKRFYYNWLKHYVMNPAISIEPNDVEFKY